MDRRPLGLGVVLVVLVAALLTPTLLGRRTSGTAVAVPIAAAPQIGDCLFDIRRVAGFAGVADGSSTVVPCTSAHHGEIITQTATIGATATSRRGGGQLPNLAACATTAYWYLGVRPLDEMGQRSNSLGAWWPAFAADFEMLRPGPLQQRVGQSWSACVLTSPHDLLIGSVAHLFGGTPRASPIALCSATANIELYKSVSCNQPHATEIMGWRVADRSSADEASLRQSCAELAVRMTGRTDPEADGELQIAVVVIRSTEGPVREGWGPGHSGPYRAACTVGTAGPRLLTGSVGGLGAAPLPWE